MLPVRVGTLIGGGLGAALFKNGGVVDRVTGFESGDQLKTRLQRFSGDLPTAAGAPPGTT
jgi:hypothetical protein